MEKKYLAGKLDKNIAFGLSWLLCPIFGIIEFILDKDVLDIEEKRDLVSSFITYVAAMLLSVTVIGGIAVIVVVIIKIINTFMGKEFKVPGAYQIASAIIK